MNDVSVGNETKAKDKATSAQARSKSANAKENQKNKAKENADFVKPIGAPPANRRSSTTLAGTPHTQHSISEYVPTPTGSQVSRKQSLESASLQMQLFNRQTDEVKKLIDANIEMEEKISQMILRGETSMLTKLEDILTARDNALESRLLRHIKEGDRKMVDEIHTNLKTNEMNIERKIIASSNDCQSKLKIDLTKSINDTMTRLNDRIDLIEEASQSSHTHITNKLSSLSQKQDSHHTELIQGMSQIEEMKSRLAYNTRKIDDVCRSTEERIVIIQNEAKAQWQLGDEKLNAINEGIRGLDTLRESVNGATTRCNELSTQFNAFSVKLNRYEAERSSQQEQMSLFRARMDKFDENMAIMNKQAKDHIGSNSFVHQMEIEHRNFNVLLSCLPKEFQSIEGLKRFALHYMGHEIRDGKLQQVFKVGDSNRGEVIKARFATMDARTRFYKARTRLGVKSEVWLNDDLSKPQEFLAHQARQLYQTGKIFRTWTYLNSVFSQRLPTDPPLKVTDSGSLRVGAADNLGNIKQMFNLVPSRTRTFLPGMDGGSGQILPSTNPFNPVGQYQPLISLNHTNDPTMSTNQLTMTTPVINVQGPNMI